MLDDPLEQVQSLLDSRAELIWGGGVFRER